MLPYNVLNVKSLSASWTETFAMFERQLKLHLFKTCTYVKRLHVIARVQIYGAIYYNGLLLLLFISSTIGVIYRALSSSPS